MTARWLSEHRRLLSATTTLLVVAALVLLAAVAGSSAALPQRHPVPTALVATQRQLAVVQGQLQRLQGLSARQAAEISHLHAELRARRVHHRTRHHRR